MGLLLRLGGGALASLFESDETAASEKAKECVMGGKRGTNGRRRKEKGEEGGLTLDACESVVGAQM